MEYYDRLEINREASIDEIKKAYRRLTLRYHPDRNSIESNSDKFMKIQEAYEILSDSNQRKYYDLTGKIITEKRITGERITGEKITGERIAGEKNTGEKITGERIAGEKNTGEKNTGEKINGGTNSNGFKKLSSYFAPKEKIIDSKIIVPEHHQGSSFDP